MTQTTKTIFERFEVRKSKKQKSAFIEWLTEQATAAGYEVTVEKGSFGARNIIVGNPDKAKVVYTAHYDTCAVLPFPNFITPKNFFLYLLYQLVLTACILFPIGVAFYIEGLYPSVFTAFLPMVVYFLVFWLLFFGPANKHTANDNTSGVVTLIDLMNAMPEHLRSEAAFIFFDLEEAGLLGSSAYAGKHKKEMKKKLLVNFDCVSDGKNIIFAVRKGAKEHVAALEQAFAANDTFSVEVATKGVFYPSDQAAFPCGVGVAALKRSKLLGLYMNRIHTPRDTVFEEDNIEFLVDGSVKLTAALAGKE